jgi:hypothetical protein
MRVALTVFAAALLLVLCVLSVAVCAHAQHSRAELEVAGGRRRFEDHLGRTCGDHGRRRLVTHA